MLTLSKIELSGFKSIEHASLELRPMNVLIGANGAGKSNLASFFRLVEKMMARGLQSFVRTQPGRGDALLFYGSKETQRIEASLEQSSDSHYFGRYRFVLRYSPPDSLIVDEDRIVFGSEVPGAISAVIDTGVTHAADETNLPSTLEQSAHKAHGIWDFLRQCKVFDFCDTSRDSRIRKSSYIHDNTVLEHDGGNLASILFRLKTTQQWAYERIVATIRQMMPWFRDFRLEPLKLNPKNVQLDWYEQDSEVLFGPHQLPDGGLRIIALVTLLLQPEGSLPSLIVLDEPELGLHPYAVAILAALVKGAAFHTQIILATQSVALVEHFEPEDIVVVERDNRASVFRRLTSDALADWLDDYTLGELWEKNVIGGGPL